MYEDIEDFRDELSRILAYAKDLDPDAVAFELETEAQKLRSPEILQGEILGPEGE
jgi:hypothetical protein